MSRLDTVRQWSEALRSEGDDARFAVPDQYLRAELRAVDVLLHQDGGMSGLTLLVPRVAQQASGVLGSRSRRVAQVDAVAPRVVERLHDASTARPRVVHVVGAVDDRVHRDRDACVGAEP